MKQDYFVLRYACLIMKQQYLITKHGYSGCTALCQYETALFGNETGLFDTLTAQFEYEIW